LTQEQYHVLDGLSENDRVLVRGGAGTGKTLLAIEEARRQARGGRRVVLFCFNRQLAAFLAGTVKDETLIRARHLHVFMSEEITRAGVRVEKGLEDEKAAIGREHHLMKRAWDWSNFVKRLDGLPKLLREAQGALGGQKLYFWLEFHHDEDRYYRLQDGVAYEQGGERVSAWNEVVEFLKRDRPDVWGDISIVRPFGLADWHDHDLLAVFESLAPMHQMWRGN
jgi:hypothetical protein